MSQFTSGCVRVFNDYIEVKKYKNHYSCGPRDYEINREDKKKERTNNNTEFVKEYKNLKRAQQNVRDIINANIMPHSKFLTLTCKENVLEYSKIKRMLQTFLQAMKREGYSLRYLGVLEHQKARGLKNNDEGAYHIHLVVFNDEKIPFEIINKHWNGYTDIHVLNGLRVKDNQKINSVAWYVCKYITKENYKEYSSHVYFCSKGLYRPTVLSMPSSETADIEVVNDFRTGLDDVLKKYTEISNSSYEFNIKLDGEVKNSIKQKIITIRYEVIK